MTVRTRFAPSPTGYLHIGGVRTALFNWLFARQAGGQFILRIDDTDQQRNVAEALQPILDGFRWLGIDWDEGPEVGGPYAPYFQSQRVEKHRAACQKLVASGHAYRDYATRAEIEVEEAEARREKRPWRYSRRWMAETDAQAAAYEAEGRQAAIRLKMPTEGACRFRDLVRGETEFPWASQQDVIVQTTDGRCLYNLATVVDDADLAISHVIRAEEHLSNTPRQIFMFEGLGVETPRFAHLPYVAEPGSKEKLSKRKISQYLNNQDFKSLYQHGVRIAGLIGKQVSADTFNPVIVDFYRDVGYLADAVVNYLLLLGWSLDDKTEDFTREEMIRDFSLERVVKSPASFDPAKLAAFQLRRMQRLPAKQKAAMALPFLQQAGLVSKPPPCDIGPKLARVVEAAGDRLKTAGDILEFSEFFVVDSQLSYDDKAFDKRVRAEGAVDRLRLFRESLATVEPFDPPALDALMHGFVAEHGLKIGDVIHALRVAVTGKGVGAGMFDTLSILGRESCLARIDAAIARAT
jgi:glutamyl-tRNA synthetase